MPKRFLSSDMWSDASFEQLCFKGKLLFIYLITSPYTSQAGIGQATDKKIASDTDLQREDLPDLFEKIKAMVERQMEWFWVKNFLQHQSCNPKFAKGALKYAKNTPFYEAFCQFNASYLNINNITDQIRSDQEVSIPYRYPIDTVSIPYQNSPVKNQKPGETIHTLLRPLNKISPSPAEMKNLTRALEAGCSKETVENLLKRKPQISNFNHDWAVDELLAQLRLDEANKPADPFKELELKYKNGV